jgi:predicted phosphodiesterase
MKKQAKRKQDPARLLVVLSDMHVGSTVGLWPPGFVSTEGFPIGQNLFQEWLWECWEHCKGWIKETTGGAAYDLLLNGDLVEGIHHRTTQVMSADVGDQSAAVLACLQDLCAAAARVWVVKGTEVHTRNDEIRLGHVLGGQRDPATGQHAFDRLETTVHGTRIAACHHIGATSRPYLEASQHSIHLGVEAIEAARDGRQPPQIIIRGHRHRHGVWTDGDFMSITTGAWQGRTRYGHKAVPGCRPRPSCVVLDWRDRQRGELPQVHYKLYREK